MMRRAVMMRLAVMMRRAVVMCRAVMMRSMVMPIPGRFEIVAHQFPAAAVLHDLFVGHLVALSDCAL